MVKCSKGNAEFDGAEQECVAEVICLASAMLHECAELHGVDFAKDIYRLLKVNVESAIKEGAKNYGK